MKKLWYMFSVCVLVLGISTSPQAQPIAGTYILPDDFLPAGDWREILTGESEGEMGNIFEAENDDAYSLTGAEVFNTVEDEVVNPRRDGTGTLPGYVKSTITYMRGILTLYNDPDAPWYNSEYLSDAFNPMFVSMSSQLWKYTDGDIMFELTMTGEWFDYQGYNVEIKATYDKSRPVSDGGSTETISDAFSQVEITITGPEIVEETEPVVETVEVDIRPLSCSNQVWVNTRWHRILPVAILGTETFDVNSIVPETVELMGIAPRRWFHRDLSAPSDSMTDAKPYYFWKVRRDGFTDLILLFKTREIVGTLGPVENGDELMLDLSAELDDGSFVTGEDMIHIRKKIKRPKKKRWCKKYR